MSGPFDGRGGRINPSGGGSPPKLLTVTAGAPALQQKQQLGREGAESLRGHSAGV
jgi:hypothetical protein